MHAILQTATNVFTETSFFFPCIVKLLAGRAAPVPLLLLLID